MTSQALDCRAALAVTVGIFRSECDFVALKITMQHSRHCERSEAIYDFAGSGLPRCARSDGIV